MGTATAEKLLVSILNLLWQLLTFKPLWGTLKIQKSIINGVGGRKNMFEKLLLAVTITLSINFFVQVRISNQTNTGSSYQQNIEKSATILVRKPQKSQSN
jgi:hypothetical protein